jgi:hypothetical protein
LPVADGPRTENPANALIAATAIEHAPPVVTLDADYDQALARIHRCGVVGLWPLAASGESAARSPHQAA